MREQSKSLNDVMHLFAKTDRTDALVTRIDAIVKWLEEMPGVEEAGLVCVDRLSLGSDNHIVHRISSEKAELLPTELAILNGKSAVPHDMFARPDVSPVTVFSPFVDTSGMFSGALLVKSPDPKQFLKNNRALLSVLASKAKDAVDLAALRSREPHVIKDDSSDLTPRAIMKLLDLLNLPMYVMDSAGTFQSVNTKFLETFSYQSLDDLNSRPDLFVHDSDWAAALENISRRDGFVATTLSVRTGDNRLRTVQDYSTLIGRAIFGVLLDVSDYVSVNETLKETLEKQRNLNERLTATTTLLQKTQATAMKSLAKLAEYRDKETGGHLQRICEYMRLVTREIHKKQPYSFHVSNEYPEDIYLSGMLHDIGKVGVPDQILLKPGPLDDAEWSVMKKHTTWGHTLLNQADHELGEQSFLTLASHIALHHHEWWDGKGYPYGLAGESIPLSARIGAVADVYDALTSRRPYKQAWLHEQAVEEISGLIGKQFDPTIGEIFLKFENQFEAIRTRFPDEPAMVG